MLANLPAMYPIGHLVDFNIKMLLHIIKTQFSNFGEVKCKIQTYIF